MRGQPTDFGFQTFSCDLFAAAACCRVSIGRTFQPCWWLLLLSSFLFSISLNRVNWFPFSSSLLSSRWISLSREGKGKTFAGCGEPFSVNWYHHHHPHQVGFCFFPINVDCYWKLSNSIGTCIHTSYTYSRYYSVGKLNLVNTPVVCNNTWCYYFLFDRVLQPNSHGGNKTRRNGRKWKVCRNYISGETCYRKKFNLNQIVYTNHKCLKGFRRVSETCFIIFLEGDSLGFIDANRTNKSIEFTL